MARSGITQAQVNEAADALLRAGERPTIERVRQSLGTGSPNTLVRLLEGWWSDLGRRLDAQAEKVAMPEAPEPVVAAASQLWLAALEHARSMAETAFTEKEEALATERAAMIQREQQRVADLIAANTTTQTAIEAQAAAETRLADLERLSHSLAQQCDDLQIQRDAATTERDALSRRLADTQDTHEQSQREAVVERQSLEAQFRTSENRWLQEVDRARQDANKVQTHLSHLETRHAKSLHDLEKRLSELQSALVDGERAQIKALATVDAQSTEIERLYAQIKAKAEPTNPTVRKRRSSGNGKSRATPRKRTKTAP